MKVPTQDLPTVAPTSAPLPLQHLDAPALAFGATAGAEGLAALGATEQQRSDVLAQHAEQFAAIDNKQASDQSNNDYLVKSNTYVGDFASNNVGMSASQNLQKAYTDLEDIRAKGGEGLSPAAKIMYDTDSRRQAAFSQSKLRDFAVTQRKGAVIKTSDATIDLNAAQAAASDDPAIIQSSIAKIALETAYQSLPNVAGLTPEEAKLKLHTAVGGIFAGKVKIAVEQQDYDKAKSILDEHRDTMTEEQFVSSMAALKVGQVSNTAHADAMAALNPGVAAPAPVLGAWDKGVQALKVDPQKQLSALAGGPVQIFSNLRTPEQNDKVGGSKTSEHLLGNAWDFSAVPGKTLQETATNVAQGLHAQGIPFDQIEVDPTNGHVHVGFGEKNRNEIIDPKGKALATLPQAVAPAVMPLPSPTADPNQFRADSLSAARAYFDAKYPNNAAQADASYSATAARISQQAEVIQAHQQSAFDRLASYAQAHDLQDDSSLASAYPGASADLALISATPHYATGLNSITKQNANELTYDRMTNITKLTGMKGTDPKTFANLNLAQVDLPRSQRLQLMKDQQTAKAQVQKGAAVNTALTSALGSVQGQATLTGLGITDKKSDEYFQFAGTLSELIDHASANGKVPPQQELNTLLSQAAAQTKKGFMGFGDAYAFQVPKDERDAAIGRLGQLGIPANEFNIAKLYANAKAQNAP